MKILQHAILSLTLASACAGTAYAMGPTGTAADFGQLVSDVAAERIINIDANTKYVNVADGETVQFQVQGQHFTWDFATFPNASFDLRKIAPNGVHLGEVEVHVASNPLYRG